MANALKTLSDVATSTGRAALRLGRRLPVIGDKLPEFEGDIWLPEAEPTPQVATSPKPVAEESAPVTSAPLEAPKPAAKAEQAPKPAAKAEEPEAPATDDLEGLLEGVSGVGPAKRKAIIAAYPTKDRLASASPEDLAGSVKGVSVDLAQKVLAKVG